MARSLRLTRLIRFGPVILLQEVLAAVCNAFDLNAAAARLQGSVTAMEWLPEAGAEECGGGDGGGAEDSDDILSDDEEEDEDDGWDGADLYDKDLMVTAHSLFQVLILP